MPGVPVCHAATTPAEKIPKGVIPWWTLYAPNANLPVVGGAVSIAALARPTSAHSVTSASIAILLCVLHVFPKRVARSATSRGALSMGQRAIPISPHALFATTSSATTASFT